MKKGNMVIDDAAAGTVPSKKRYKKNNDCDDEPSTIIMMEESVLLDTVWQYYCDYFFTSVHDDDEEEEEEEEEVEEDIDVQEEEEEEEEEDEEKDELVKIFNLIQNQIPDAMNEVFELPPHHDDDIIKAAITSSNTTTMYTRRQLIPLLISVTATLIADQYIEKYMEIEVMITTTEDDNEEKDNNDNNDNKRKENDKNPDVTFLEEKKRNILQSIRQYLLQAMTSFPNNAAAIQMSINYLRITQHQPRHNTTTTSLRSTTLAQWYIYAANIANRTRSMAIKVLKNDYYYYYETDDDEIQEWIVALLFNQVCGVDEIIEPPQQQQQNDDDDDDDEKVDDEQEDVTTWSSSTVEGTCRYMASMIYSMSQQHDLALIQLRLLDITHRLHPNLWRSTIGAHVSPSSSLPPIVSEKELNPTSTSSFTTTTTTTTNTVSPISFRGITTNKNSSGNNNINNGIIPQHLYQQLCHIFQPDADYWYTSQYANRGYFSFYMDLPSPPSQSKSCDGHVSRNVIDDIVQNHLLPLIQQSESYQTNDTTNTIIGYEWWVHTRARTANLGHNLHFDTDEALLRRNGTVSHPYISSVLYLTGGSDSSESNNNNDDNDHHGGPTIVLDQTPDSTTNAAVAWYSHPINNSFMIFPGNLLHGVLPCFHSNTNTITPPDEKDNTTATTTVPVSSEEASIETLIQSLSEDDATNPTSSTPKKDTTNRLTLMIGFWTRNVLADMDPKLSYEDRLYGPCSPLPSAEDAPWVRELCAGYNNNDDNNNNNKYGSATGNDDSVTTTTTKISIENVVTVPLPCVSPAWEEIVTTTKTTAAEPSDSMPSLTIPRDIDHRFFVIDAPQCFKTQLTEAQYSIDAHYYNDNEDDDDADDDDEE